MRQLGRYELGAMLGEGGFGQVFEATLHGPGALIRVVALEVMHPGRRGLRREARIGALLRHRHLVNVVDLGTDQDRYFCAMELCAGGALSRYLPLPPRAVVEVGLAVCAALGYAHGTLGLTT